MKTCTECLVELPEDRFYRYKTGKTYKLCKTCHVARTERHAIKNGRKSQREDQWRRRGMNITVEQYEALHDLQEGKCAVCGRQESASGRRLALDHDHETGEIRGLLCTKCNTTLGWIEMYSVQFDTYLGRK